jgi:hypothetical protein
LYEHELHSTASQAESSVQAKGAHFDKETHKDLARPSSKKFGRRLDAPVATATIAT